MDKSNISEAVASFLQEQVRTEVLLQRLNCPDTDLFVIFEKDSRRPVGFYWSLISNRETYWHDSFRIPLNTALVFNAYVSTAARRKGIYSELICEIHKYLFEERRCTAVFTIVEKQNMASLKANLKAGLHHYKKNILIKIFNKNVLSVYKNGRTETFFILFRKKNTIL